MTKPSRMPPIPEGQLSPEQSKAVADIVAGPRGSLVGPFIPLLRSPDFMNRLQKTGEYLRFNSTFETRLSELAILITARAWSQNFESPPANRGEGRTAQGRHRSHRRRAAPGGHGHGRGHDL
jgi:4-carboxymuconolactone decarboxylase